MQAIRDNVANLDYRISRSTLGTVFHLHGSRHEKEIKNALFFTEIRAGITTFCTMAYIIAVNAAILTDSGGTCICNSTTDPTCATDAAYSSCLQDLNRDFITATAAISGISTILFGLFTNLPIALAPGMGMNAYFAYQVVGFHGTGSVPYRLALTAVFVEGFVFVFLSLIGMRQWLVKLIPNSIKIASGVGIGLFLTIIGLSSSAGIGAISAGGISTPLAIAGCPDEFINQTTGACDSHVMTDPRMWIGITCGGILTTYLMAYRFRLAIVIGIVVVSIISWPRNTNFTYFPHTDDGDSRFEFFRHVVAFHPIRNLAAQDWNISGTGGNFALALFTFLYVDIIDCTATLYSMARFAGAVDPESGDFPRSTLAYCTDAISISIGSIFGLSPVTAFVESGAGIAEGGKTGLTAITTGTCFLISIFFAPIFASIPPWATGCTLILVGCMMMRQVTTINWAYIGDALPAFVTLSFMPLSYSVAYGLIAGLMTYILVNGLIYITRKISRDRLTPPDFDIAEYWTFNPSGGRLPWFMRAAKNGGRFWDHEKPEEGWEKEEEQISSHQRFDSSAELRHDVEIVGGRDSRRSNRPGDFKEPEIGLQNMGVAR